MSTSTERTIPRLVAAAAEAYPARTAIEDGGVTMTFPELAAAGLRAARAFCASGIESGDRVAVWAPNLYEWIVATIGLQSAGAVLVPLNTRLKGGEAAYILNKSGARLLFTMEEFLGTRYVEMLGGRDLPALEEIVTLRGADSGSSPERGFRSSGWEDFLSRAEGCAEDEARARAAAVSPDSLSDVLFTSGTTGKPKGVMTAHGQNLKVFEAWTEVVGLEEGDRYLIQNPFFHSFGYKAGWLSAIMRGATILPHLVFDVPAVLERIGRDRISVYPAPPSAFQSILAYPDFARYDLSSLRLTVTGAAPVPVELVQRMRDELGFETIITGYGLTETCGTVAMCRYDDDPETIALTSGRAIPDIEVRCVDDDGKEVPRGEPGEIVVRGYNLMRGYFDDDAETARAIDGEGWLHTGDIAIMNERGYVTITDRKKDMFIMGGFNCYPAEIENLMYEHHGIAQVGVIGVPDERMGEVGMAFVIPATDAELDAQEIIAWCRENMANYKVPRRVAIVDELPTNATGKIMKFVLREWAEEGVGGAA